MWEIFGAGLAFVFPVVMHFSCLWGEVLLARVVTPFPRFDAAYNKRPLVLSLLAGAFLAAATLARPHAAAFYAFVAAGLTLLVLDMAATLVSLARHIKNRRRR